MATQPNFSGRKLIIRVGNGASPEVFSIFCTFNGDRAIQFDAATTDEMDIDCDNPTAVGWMVSQVDSLSATISGAGRVKAVDVPEFFSWFESGEPRNIEVEIDAPGGGTFEGAALLTSWNVNGGETGSATADISMRFTGPVTYTEST
jgi:predicted secreted protein